MWGEYVCVYIYIFNYQHENSGFEKQYTTTLQIHTRIWYLKLIKNKSKDCPGFLWSNNLVLKSGFLDILLKEPLGIIVKLVFFIYLIKMFKLYHSQTAHNFFFYLASMLICPKCFKIPKYYYYFQTCQIFNVVSDIFIPHCSY